MTLDAGGGGGASPLAAAAGAKAQKPLLADAWIVQKLKNDWSSSDFGGLLTRERLSDAVASFRLLDTAVKVRFLLSFLSMRREVVEESKFAIVEIIDAAENDAEEWVRVGAGIVKQYMFMSEDGAESGDTFFHEQIASTTAKVLEAVDAPAARTSDDFFCHEDAFLNPSVRAETPAPTVRHFTVVEASAATANGKSSHAGDEKSAQGKAAQHRLQLPRPALHAVSSSASAPTRVTPTTVKPPPPPPPRKNMTELSEIRRKADAGRFKRHRSRISMIDIDEVKQIELDKVQKAEERKKQKLANAAKEKAAAAAAAAAGGGAAVSEKPGVNGAGEGEAYGDEAQEEALPQSALRPVAEGFSQQDDDEELDDHHDEDEEEDDEEDAHGVNGTSAHHIHHRDDERSEYVADGTQALLNAAIMTEAVGLQQHTMHSQHQYQHHYEPEQQQQQQQQQHYHRGFEPEDASQHMPFGYGFTSSYASHFGDHGYQQQQQQQPPPFQLPHMQSQYSAGFLDDQSPPHAGGQPRLPGFDQTHTNGNHSGGYEAPEYWR